MCFAGAWAETRSLPVEMESGTGDLEMILMGMDTGTLGVARLRTGHLICVYAEVRSVRSNYILFRSPVGMLKPDQNERAAPPIMWLCADVGCCFHRFVVVEGSLLWYRWLIACGRS